MQDILNFRACVYALCTKYVSSMILIGQGLVSHISYSCYSKFISKFVVQLYYIIYPNHEIMLGLTYSRELQNCSESA